MGSSFSSVQSPQTSGGGKSGLLEDAINSQKPSTATASIVSEPNLPPPITFSPQTSSGKGGGMQGSQGSVTFPGQGGQPQMGMPNAYSNTVGPQPEQQSSWDNSSSPSGKGSAGSSGKGKGA